MIYFIDPNKNLWELRDEILSNTRTILLLLEKRAELSKKIAKVKENQGLPIRDLKREIEIIKKFGKADKFTLGALNFLFEYSIDFQIGRKIELPWKKMNIGNEYYKVIDGNRNIIELITGILLGKFGKIIYISKEIPVNLEIGFILKGSHIIKSHKKKNLMLLKLGIEFEHGIANIVYKKDSAKLIIPNHKFADFEENNIKVVL